MLDWQHQHNRLHPVVLVPSETSLAASQNKCYDMLQIPSALLRVSIWSGLFYSSHRAETSPIHSNIPDCLFSRFGSVLCLPSPSPKNEIRIPNNTNKPSKIEVDSFAHLQVAGSSINFWPSHRAETSPIHSNIPDCLFSRFGSVLCLPSPSPKNEIRIPNNTNKPSKIEVDSFAHLQVAGSSINFWLHRNRICLFSHPLNPDWG